MRVKRKQKIEKTDCVDVRNPSAMFFYYFVGKKTLKLLPAPRELVTST